MLDAAQDITVSKIFCRHDSQLVDQFAILFFQLHLYILLLVDFLHFE